jgi:16S rRNA (guanine527-N7)-methyltransferase
MAIVRPDVHFTLVEPMERRAMWLEDVVSELGLVNVDVLRARAEDVGDSSFDVATARAVAPTEKLLKLLVPLVRTSSDGRVIAIKGQRVAEEISEAQRVIQKLKLAEVEIQTLGDSEIPESVTLLVARLKHRE